MGGEILCTRCAGPALARTASILGYEGCAATLKSKLPDAVKKDLVRNRTSLPSWAACVVRSLVDTHVSA